MDTVLNDFRLGWATEEDASGAISHATGSGVRPCASEAWAPHQTLASQQTMASQQTVASQQTMASQRSGELPHLDESGEVECLFERTWACDGWSSQEWSSPERPARDDQRARALIAETGIAESGVVERTAPSNSPHRSCPYQLTRQLGRGAMGEVWQARDEKLGREVAVKLLHNAHRPDALLREARLAARVAHPNVVHVYDAGTIAEGQEYLVMELLQGEDLEALLQRTGRLSSRQGVEIALSVLAGLEAVHAEGVLHRDIKPSNVFLARRNGHIVPKLVDFGVACPMGQGADQLVGTPIYMAPEQLMQGAPASEQTEVFALACVLFRMLTGEQIGSTSSSQRSALEIARSRDLSPLEGCCDGSLKEILERALSADPQTRTASARAFRDELHAWLFSQDAPE